MQNESTQRWKESRFLQLSDAFYRSIIKRFEILSGKEFSSKVFASSAYKAAGEILDSGESDNNDLPKFLQVVIETTTGRNVIKNEIRKEFGGIVQMRDSLEAESYGPSSTAVCYLSQGIISSVNPLM